MAEPTIRDGRDDDAAALIELIGAVFDEYAGCVLDVDGEEPDLRAIATAYARRGGRFWVAEVAGRVVGCIGCAPLAAEGGFALRKLYVALPFRGTGLGARLSQLVEDEARRNNAHFVELWSDTRFVRAHEFYARRGYVRGADTRALGDKSESIEFYYRLELSRDIARE